MLSHITEAEAAVEAAASCASHLKDVLDVWNRVLEDPCLQDLPYKIETNRFGQIVMSPASNKHGIVQAAICTLLSNIKTNGAVIVECSVATTEGVKVPDVGWASAAFLTVHGDEIAFTAAPELCVEIRSPSNSSREILEKKSLYFQSGAVEVWVSDLSGNILFYDLKGPVEQSRLYPQFPKTVI